MRTSNSLQTQPKFDNGLLSDVVIVLARLDSPATASQTKELDSLLREHTERCLPYLLFGEMHLAVIVKLSHAKPNKPFHDARAFWESAPLSSLLKILRAPAAVETRPSVYVTRAVTKHADELFCNLREASKPGRPFMLTLVGRNSAVCNDVMDIAFNERATRVPLDGTYSHLVIEETHGKSLGTLLGVQIEAGRKFGLAQFIMPGISIADGGFSLAGIGYELPELFEFQARLRPNATCAVVDNLAKASPPSAKVYASHGRHDTIVAPIELTPSEMGRLLVRIRSDFAETLDGSRAFILANAPRAVGGSRALPENSMPREPLEVLPVPLYTRHSLDGIDYSHQLERLTDELRRVYDLVFKVVAPATSQKEVESAYPEVNVLTFDGEARTINADNPSEQGHFRISLRSTFRETWGPLLIRHESIQDSFVTALQVSFRYHANDAVRRCCNPQCDSTELTSMQKLEVERLAVPLWDQYQNTCALLRTSLARNLASAVDLCDYGAHFGVPATVVSFRQFSELTWAGNGHPSREEKEARVRRFLGAKLLISVANEMRCRGVVPGACVAFEQHFYNVLFTELGKATTWATDAEFEFEGNGHMPLASRLLTLDLPALLPSSDKSAMQAICAGIVLELAWRSAISILIAYLCGNSSASDVATSCIAAAMQTPSVPEYMKLVREEVDVDMTVPTMASGLNQVLEIVENSFPWLEACTRKYSGAIDDLLGVASLHEKALWGYYGGLLSECFLAALMRYPTATEEFLLRHKQLPNGSAAAPADGDEKVVDFVSSQTAKTIALAAWIGYQADSFVLTAERAMHDRRALLRILEALIFNLAVQEPANTQLLTHVAGVFRGKKCVDGCNHDCSEQFLDCRCEIGPAPAAADCSEGDGGFEINERPSGTYRQTSGKASGKVHGGEVLFRMPPMQTRGDCLTFGTVKRLLHDAPERTIDRVSRYSRWWSPSGDNKEQGLISLDQALMVSSELLCLGWIKKRIPRIARKLKQFAERPLLSINVSPELLDDQVIPGEVWEYCGFAELLQTTVELISDCGADPVIEIREGYLVSRPNMGQSISTAKPLDDQTRWNGAIQRLQAAVADHSVKIAIDDQFGNLTDSVRVQYISRASGGSMCMVKIDFTVVHRLLELPNPLQKGSFNAVPAEHVREFGVTLGRHVRYCLGTSLPEANELVLVFEGFEQEQLLGVFQQLCGAEVSGVTSIFAQGPHTQSLCPLRVALG